MIGDYSFNLERLVMFGNPVGLRPDGRATRLGNEYCLDVSFPLASASDGTSVPECMRSRACA
eukprot:4456195-Pyramimonas_sp.AAC.1